MTDETMHVLGWVHEYTKREREPEAGQALALARKAFRAIDKALRDGEATAEQAEQALAGLVLEQAEERTLAVRRDCVTEIQRVAQLAADRCDLEIVRAKRSALDEVKKILG